MIGGMKKKRTIPVLPLTTVNRLGEGKNIKKELMSIDNLSTRGQSSTKASPGPQKYCSNNKLRRVTMSRAS